MDCPKCLGRLEKTKITVRATSELKELQGSTRSYELEIDKCFVCDGVWFDQGELKKYLSDQIDIIDSPSKGKETNKEMDEKHGNCPKCLVIMKKSEAPKLSEMTIDTCEECQGIWLDPTEIDRLERAHKPKLKLDIFSAIAKGFKRPSKSS